MILGILWRYPAFRPSFMLRNPGGAGLLRAPLRCGFLHANLIPINDPGKRAKPFASLTQTAVLG
jgi:hypothetical protein